MHASLRLWCDRQDRERREEWSLYETYCREIERATGISHASLVPSETHKEVQQQLGLHQQYNLHELPWALRRLSHEAIQNTIQETTNQKGTK
jgi:hypothetical protein